MRSHVAALLGAGLLLLGACSSTDGAAADEETTGAADDSASSRPFIPTPSRAPEDGPDPDGPDSGPDSGPDADAGADLSATETCAAVRAGIDAFNVGDLEGTIALFEQAVPLAEDLARDQPSPDADTLLDAVRYYAAVPVDDYVEESQTSPDFLRFKDFTLRECAYGNGPAPAEPEDTGIPA